MKNSVLQEAGSRGSLFISQDGKRQQFQELTLVMRELLDRRRQILSKTLPRVSYGVGHHAECCTFSHLPSPQDELKELKQLVGSRIDQGNRMLSMDLVPRDENGSPIDPKTAGVMHLYRAVSDYCNTPLVF